MSVERKPFNSWSLIVVTVVVALGGWLTHVLSISDFETGAKAHKIFNVAEGLTWVCIGIVLFWRSRSFQRVRSPTILAGVTFILFGVSDFIEFRTGSWYQPVWLLIWNVACVAFLVVCLAWYVALRRKQN